MICFHLSLGNKGEMFVGLMGRRNLDTGKKTKQNKKTVYILDAFDFLFCERINIWQLQHSSTFDRFPEMEDDWNSGAYWRKRNPLSWPIKSPIWTFVTCWRVVDWQDTQCLFPHLELNILVCIGLNQRSYADILAYNHLELLVVVVAGWVHIINKVYFILAHKSWKKCVSQWTE